MKKFFVLITIAMFSANVANAQFSNLLNKAKEAASSAVSSATGNSSSSDSGSSNLLSTLKNVISSKLIPTSDQIVGTWAYQKPAVMFTSDNALKSTTASLATSSVENKMQTYLSAAGIKKGSLSITFNSDKSFTINRSGKSLASGTYTINGNNVTMTFKGKKSPCSLIPQLDNGTLCLVGDVSKVKTFLENAGSKLNNNTVKTLTTLSKSMSGMKVGIRMSK